MCLPQSLRQTTRDRKRFKTRNFLYSYQIRERDMFVEFAFVDIFFFFFTKSKDANRAKRAAFRDEARPVPSFNIHAILER